MDYNLILSPRAEIEIDNAMDWYKSKVKGLEMRFLIMIKLHLKRIQNNPLLFSKKEYEFRICKVDVFPFIILYKIENDTIIIHSIFNTYQNPSKKI